jgi:hypothetical protein
MSCGWLGVYQDPVFLGFFLKKYSQLFNSMTDLAQRETSSSMSLGGSPTTRLPEILAPSPSDHYLIHPLLGQTPDLAKYRVDFK